MKHNINNYFNAIKLKHMTINLDLHEAMLDCIPQGIEISPGSATEETTTVWTYL